MPAARRAAREEDMAKLLVHGNFARKALARGVARLAAAVEPTLGPKGSTPWLIAPWAHH